MWSRFTTSCPDLSAFSGWRSDQTGTADARGSHGDGDGDGDAATSSTDRPACPDAAPCPSSDSSAACASSSAQVEPAVEATPAATHTLQRPVASPASTHRVILSRAQRREPDDAPRAAMAQARRMLLDPDTPAALRTKLERWTRPHAEWAEDLTSRFAHHFRPLAEQAGPRMATRFDSDILPSLREAAVVCVALGLYRLPAVRRSLDQNFRFDWKEARAGRIAHSARFLAELLMVAAWSIALLERGRSLGRRAELGLITQGPDNPLGWTAAAGLMTAAPAIAWVDSLMVRGRLQLEDHRLLKPETRFRNVLAQRLNEDQMRGPRHTAWREACTVLLGSALLRAAALPALQQFLISRRTPMDVAAYASLHMLLDFIVLRQLVPTRLNRQRLPPSLSLSRDFRALSATQFPAWALHHHQTSRGSRQRLRAFLVAVGAGLWRPSTYVRAAAGVTPFLLAHDLALALLPPPVGAANFHRPASADHRLRPGAISGLEAMLLGIWASLLSAASIVTAQGVRAWAERTLDPVTERWLRRASHALCARLSSRDERDTLSVRLSEADRPDPAREAARLRHGHPA